MSAAAAALTLATAEADGGESNRPNQADEDRIRIGFRRLQALRKVLSLATPKSYETLQLHRVWAGDYALSALSDECLGLDYIWQNSLPPQQALPDEVTLVARDAASQSHRDLITKGVVMKPMV